MDTPIVLPNAIRKRTPRSPDEALRDAGLGSCGRISGAQPEENAPPWRLLPTPKKWTSLHFFANTAGQMKWVALGSWIWDRWNSPRNLHISKKTIILVFQTPLIFLALTFLKINPHYAFPPHPPVQDCPSAELTWERPWTEVCEGGGRHNRLKKYMQTLKNI